MAQGIKFQILKFQHSNQLSKDAQLLTCQQRGRVRRPRRDRAAAQPHRLLSTPGKKHSQQSQGEQQISVYKVDLAAT